MTTITLQVPDQLARRIAPLQAQLPQLLAHTLDLYAPEESTPPQKYSLTEEIINFLASRPTTEQIIDFKVSSSTQQRLDALLEKKSSGKITPAEIVEYNAYRQVNHIFILLKAQTRASLLNSDKQ